MPGLVRCCLSDEKAKCREGTCEVWPGGVAPAEATVTGGVTLALSLWTPYVAACRLPTPFDHKNSSYQGNFF